MPHVVPPLTLPSTPPDYRLHHSEYPARYRDAVPPHLVTADGRTLRHCFYGPEDGVPVIAHSGTPSSRSKRPSMVETMEKSRLRLLYYDRPGYGGSTRQPGRTVADAASDTAALADAQGWERFAVLGGSGGGPHALAAAALLPGRVLRCAVLSGIKPTAKPELDEATLRPELAEIGAGVLAKVAAGGPEFPTEPGAAARDNPDARGHVYPGGHLPGPDIYADIYDWLASSPSR